MFRFCDEYNLLVVLLDVPQTEWALLIDCGGSSLAVGVGTLSSRLGVPQVGLGVTKVLVVPEVPEVLGVPQVGLELGIPNVGSNKLANVFHGGRPSLLQNSIGGEGGVPQVGLELGIPNVGSNKLVNVFHGGRPSLLQNSIGGGKGWGGKYAKSKYA